MGFVTKHVDVIANLIDSLYGYRTLDAAMPTLKILGIRKSDLAPFPDFYLEDDITDKDVNYIEEDYYGFIVYESDDRDENDCPRMQCHCYVEKNALESMTITWNYETGHILAFSYHPITREFEHLGQ